ncbi:hypothetical protein H4Q26_014543 [Puccinia striiformis f. sp. tritici PST-130]|uniref:Uncharacterized protein n=1 Tax=Puccinia striiformis f. sp. tritici PST-78 TaxID=1165861 RepID=A0A0L0W1X2_9BASI|nr:hypothetical protein H4Q26_014543 [Puccinia striiformis f. sp. tritici PST-130]KNF05457.1 hypothetical protein PSTG_01267 [Puccinia striiformis f. sp. tritici PST-78]
MESHGAYGRIQLFLEDLNLVLGYLPPSIPWPYTNFNFNSLGLQQNSWRRPTHRSRAWKQNRRGNGQERPWDARHPPPHASPTKQSKIHSDSNACVVRLPPHQLPTNVIHYQHERCCPGGMGLSTSQMRSDTQQLEDYQFHSKRDVDQHRQLQGDCLGFDGDPPIEFAIETEDVDRMFIHAPYDGQHDEFVEHGNNHYCDTAINENDEDATQLEDHHVVAALLPVNFGSAEPPTDDLQDPSELGELHLETTSNCDARSDLGIDVNPAQYDQSCSHSSSASVRSLVPSTDNCHEWTNFSDPLQPDDNPDHSDCSDQHDERARDNDAYNDTLDNHLHMDPDIYTLDLASDFEGQHSDHDPGEDQYADGGHYDAGDVYDDHGADLDPGDDYHDNYHDDYYDDGGDFDYYDDDY